MKGYKTSCRLGFVAVSAITLTACSENDSMLYVRGVMYREPGNCTAFDIEEGADLITNGVYDVAFGKSYTAALLVGNQLASRGDKTRARTETSNVTLEGAEVTLKYPDGSLLRDTFTTPAQAFVKVGSGQDTGFGMLGVVVIPSSAGVEAIKKGESGGYTIAEIRAFGHTLGGQSIESGTFKFPISICYGCLVDYGSVNENTGLCEKATEDVTMPCNVGQDDTVECSACAARVPICLDPEYQPSF